VLAINARIFRYDLFALSGLHYAVQDAGTDWRKDHDRDLARPVPEARKLSLCLQLSDPGAYQGGALEVKRGEDVDVAPRTRGALIAFPATMAYRLAPIASGLRKSLLFWAAGPEFR
jgi:PKHD-type hydroxylase